MSKGKLLKGFADNISKISNFGVAVSGSNCSARSNAILRLGATRDNLIQMIRTSPTIWQYAKKAGFRTVFIDAQDSSKLATKPNDFQNYMTNAEAAYIDKFYKIKNIDPQSLITSCWRYSKQNLITIALPSYMQIKMGRIFLIIITILCLRQSTRR